MKYLVLFAVLALAYALWRQQRRTPPPVQQSRPPSAPAAPQDMVACAHCGVHLPQDRALSSRQEWYCTQAHLEQGPKSIQR